MQTFTRLNYLKIAGEKLWAFAQASFDNCHLVTDINEIAKSAAHEGQSQNSLVDRQKPHQKPEHTELKSKVFIEQDQNTCPDLEEINLQFSLFNYFVILLLNPDPVYCMIRKSQHLRKRLQFMK